MISLNFSPAKCSQDELVKQQAAQKQMRELLLRLEGGVKYRILTQADRNTLLNEGFARELVDNLVYLTLGKEDNRQQDQQISGFTLAGLDPSLYGCGSILKNVQKINGNCCSYCESFLLASGEGGVQHFRPPSQVQNSSSMLPSPYLPLAYAQDNLLYTCKVCHEQYKRFGFPVVGPRFPEVAIEQEKALLINPYLENPRDFIRFNPLNGQAYPYDLVVKYYQECHGMDSDEVEKTLWCEPQCIPLMDDQPLLSAESPSDNEGDDAASALPKSKESEQAPSQLKSLKNQPQGAQLKDAKPQDYGQWLAKQDAEQANSRGAINIAYLGLNRTALIIQRMSMLGKIGLEFSSTMKDKTLLDKQAEDIQVEGMATYQYRSLAIDAIHTWRSDNKNSQAQLPRLGSPPLDSTAITSALPMWFVSSLLYFVPEDELGMAGKRRLVGLFSKDKYYGKGYDHKCLFLDIDWSDVTDNIIKVRDSTHTWETSFSELALSREMDVRELFTHNEVWVEGDYASLN